jgi:hypothetical protein
MVRLIPRAQLDSPGGLAIAPASFGELAGALLVGNFGNGRIHAYDAKTGHFLGTLKDPDGEPIQIDGLWALKVGNGANGGDANKVYFTAGLFHETHGLFGSLTPVAEGTPEGPAEAQMVQAALDVFQMDLKVVLNDISSGVTGTALQQAIRDLDAAFVDLAQAEIRFAIDSRNDLSPHKHHGSDSDNDAVRVALDDVFADLGSLLRVLG